MQYDTFDDARPMPGPMLVPLPGRATSSCKPGVAIAEQIRMAQVRQCFESLPQAQLVTIVNGVVLYLFLKAVVETNVLGAWLAAMIGIGALRTASYWKFRRCNDLPAQLRRWEAVSFAGAAVAGLLWGSASYFLFVADSISHQAYLSFVIAGMVAGAVSTLSVQLCCAIVFIVLSIAPLAYQFATATHEFAFGMSFMVTLFMGMMLIAATRYSRNHRNTLAESLRREAAEQDLVQIAYFDPLTELPNRRLFADYMQRARASASRHGTLMAVCHLDLDNFKAINDRHGHEIGDRVLVLAARTLKHSVRAGDVVARWGGDEFALLLTDLRDAEACATTLSRLLEALAVPQKLHGIAYRLSASIGATLVSGESDDPDTLLRQADQAMYLAKRAGRSGYHIFDAEKDGDDRRRAEARRLLRTALDNDELRLYFQPKVEMDLGIVYGAEALVRWQHPERGLLAPGAFLPLWEADESMVELDRWVLKRAIAQLDLWLARGLHLDLSVNVSAWLLHDAHFIDFLGELFASHPRTRGRIELEVTETRALDDINRISEVMAQCARMDVEFALDDFGTGFSSLVHLQRLPARALKVDTSFVRAMLENENDRNLVKGIIGLGDALGKEVVAEGVESIEHGIALLQLGCRRAQGYGIARPMPAADLPTWIARYVAPAAWRGLCAPAGTPQLRSVAVS